MKEDILFEIIAWGCMAIVFMDSLFKLIRRGK